MNVACSQGQATTIGYDGGPPFGIDSFYAAGFCRNFVRVNVTGSFMARIIEMVQHCLHRLGAGEQDHLESAASPACVVPVACSDVTRPRQVQPQHRLHGSNAAGCCTTQGAQVAFTSLIMGNITYASFVTLPPEFGTVDLVTIQLWGGRPAYLYQARQP